MRKVELADATDLLSEYARKAGKETVVVTRSGRPMVALVPIGSEEWEDLVVSTNPDFVAIMKRSEARYRAEGGISTDAMRRRLVAQRKSARKRKTG